MFLGCLLSLCAKKPVKLKNAFAAWKGYIFLKGKQVTKCTLPKTNIALENRLSKKTTSLPTIYFQGLVSGRVNKNNLFNLRGSLIQTLFSPKSARRRPCFTTDNRLLFGYDSLEEEFHSLRPGRILTMMMSLTHTSFGKRHKRLYIACPYKSFWALESIRPNHNILQT